MAHLSAGVYIYEQDSSTIVPAVGNNTAFFAGQFNRGPVDTPFVITSKKDLQSVFGTPDDKNYNDYFQAAKFLDYANQLVITRAFEEAPKASVIFDAKASARENVGVFTSTGGSTFEIELDNGNGKASPLKLEVGDKISLANGTKILEVELISPTVSKTKIEVQVKGGTVPAQGVTGTVYLYTFSHKNGATEALVPNVAGDANYNNIDIKGVTGQDGDYTAKRLAYTNYELIKSDDEFDYLDSLDANPLRDFTYPAESRIKFMSKTPTTETTQIAIATAADFVPLERDGKLYNFTVAFKEAHGDAFEYTMLTDLFQYAPGKNEVAIALKQGGAIETFIVGFDPQGVDGNNKSTYIENVINEQSKFVYALLNSAVHGLPDRYLESDKEGPDASGAPAVPQNGVLIVQGGKNPSITSGSLKAAYMTVDDKEKYEIDVVIGNERDPQVALELADKRKDCIAFVGARYEDTVGKKASDAVNEIVKYITHTGQSIQSAKLTRTMFGSFFANYFRIYDAFNKKYRWISVAGDMAGIRCSVTSSNASWWISAGMKRGIIRGIDRMAFSPSEPQRDLLYKNGANPLVTFPGTGNLVWGNKTLQPFASSFDRINVRNLFNTIERAMQKAARSEVFEFNDAYTRNAMTSMFNPYLGTIKAGRGIIDFKVICDESNNTPDVIRKNELRVDIFVKPNYAAEFIELHFTNVGTRSFAEVIGA